MLSPFKAKRSPCVIFATYLIVLIIGCLIGRIFFPREISDTLKENQSSRSSEKTNLSDGFFKNTAQENLFSEELSNPLMAVILGKELAANNPEQAIEQIGKIKNLARKRLALQGFLREWATLDPVAAEAAAKEHLSPKDFQTMLPHLLSGWLENDPLTAMTYMEDLPPSEIFRTEDYVHLLEEWVPNDTELAQEIYANLKSEKLTGILEQAILATLSEEDPQLANRWINEKLTGSRKQEALLSFIKILSGKNPKLAAQEVKLLPDTDLKLNALRNLATEWIQSDASEAFEWLQGLEETPYKDGLYFQMLEEYAHLDPEEASQWASEIDDPAVQREITDHIALSWGDSDPEKASQWAQNLPLDHPRRMQALDIAFEKWARQDPEKALEAIAALDASDPSRSSLEQRALLETANNNPAYAATLLEQIDSENRPQMIRQLSSQWTNLAPEAAEAWIGTLDGEDYQQALDAALPALYELDLTRAIHLIAGSPDLEKRQALLEKNLRELSVRDPAQAQQAISNGPFSEPERENLQRILENE